jgi:hypothetical protein
MDYEITGLASLHTFLGDAIVYRKLVPADPRLPGFAELREPLGLKGPYPPRKSEAAYGQVIAAVLRHARALDRPRVPLRRLVYIGDTRMNDGTAFAHICAAGGWPGRAFIGRDDLDHPAQVQEEGSLYIANRWAALPAFLEQVGREGFTLDEGTAVVVDVDKTAIAARGRNDHVLSVARMEGLERTAAKLLGPGWDPSACHRAYTELDRPAYHPFTADNQDYLAYICLALGAGLLELPDLVAEVQSGTLRSFGELLAHMEGRRTELARCGLLPVHEGFWEHYQAGDPTPFKVFRAQEYLATAARLGPLPGATVEEVLAQRIVLTGEVCAAALDLRARGALLLAVSDKPDEATAPAGRPALHQLKTLILEQYPPTLRGF